VAPFFDGADRTIYRNLYVPLGFGRASRQKLVHNLETQHQSLKGLQQSVVQFSRDTSALALARLEVGLKLPVQLAHPQEVEGENREERRNREECPSPPCGPPGRVDRDANDRARLAPESADRCALNLEEVLPGR